MDASTVLCGCLKLPMPLVPHTFCFGILNPNKLTADSLRSFKLGWIEYPPNNNLPSTLSHALSRYLTWLAVEVSDIHPAIRRDNKLGCKCMRNLMAKRNMWMTGIEKRGLIMARPVAALLIGHRFFGPEAEMGRNLAN